MAASANKNPGLVSRGYVNWPIMPPWPGYRRRRSGGAAADQGHATGVIRMRHANGNWVLPEKLDNWQQVMVALLMDIRDHLKAIRYDLDPDNRREELRRQAVVAITRKLRAFLPVRPGMSLHAVAKSVVRFFGPEIADKLDPATFDWEKVRLSPKQLKVLRAAQTKTPAL